MPNNEPFEPLKMQLAARNGINGAEARDFAATERGKMVEFLRDCDVAILDAQYTDEEYRQHVGWGHSSLGSVVSLALDANVGKLVLFHHARNTDVHVRHRTDSPWRVCAAHRLKGCVPF